MLSPPSLHVRLALLLSLLYYAATDPHGLLGVRLLGRSEARLLVIAAVVSQISGRRLIAAMTDPATRAARAPADGDKTAAAELTGVEEKQRRQEREAVHDTGSAGLKRLQRRRAAGQAASARQSG